MIHKLRQDEGSHWYLVPTTEIKEFDKLYAEIKDSNFSDTNLISKFVGLYSEFRISNPFDLDILK